MQSARLCGSGASLALAALLVHEGRNARDGVARVWVYELAQEMEHLRRSSMSVSERHQGASALLASINQSIDRTWIMSGYSSS